MRAYVVERFPSCKVGRLLLRDGVYLHLQGLSCPDGCKCRSEVLDQGLMNGNKVQTVVEGYRTNGRR